VILALQFDKAYHRPRRCFGNPLGVAIIVLPPLDVRADIFGRHQPNVIAVTGEHATRMIGAATGLHSDDARRKLHLLMQFDEGELRDPIIRDDEIEPTLRGETPEMAVASRT
jgi:hypothetical protein